MAAGYVRDGEMEDETALWVRVTRKTGRVVKVYNQALNHCPGGTKDGQATESQAI